MSGALVTFRAAGMAFKTPSPRREDRWSDVLVTNGRRFTTATALVLLASAALHGMLVATTLLDQSQSRPPQPPHEIEVEVVPDVPKPPDPVGKTETPAPRAPAPRQAAAPPEPPPALKPTLPPSPPPAPPAPPKEEASLKAMRDELTKLQAEHAALEAERSAVPPRPAAPAGLGPLPDSFQAVALPSESSEEGEAVGYAAVVFSRLAKAKAIGGEMGQPGTAAVHFVIDTTGALIGVELVHSSGIKKLDDEALDIVRRAAPFPVPPQGAQRDFSANVSFVAGQ